MMIKQSWLNWRRLIIDDRELSFGAKSIALYLNTYMNDSHDMAFPSIERVRGEMGIGSNTTVIKYLSELEEFGYLKKQKRFGNSNIYHTTIPEKIISITDSVVLQDLNNSITGSKRTVLQDLNTNKQENNQFNNQNAHKEKISFKDFWLNYPIKKDKKRAETAFNRLPNTKRKLAVKDIQHHYDGTDKKFIPHAATYINGERWEDEKPSTGKPYGYGGI